MFPVQYLEHIIDNERIRIEFSLWHNRIFHQSDILANYLFTLIFPLCFYDIFNGILLNHTRNATNTRKIYFSLQKYYRIERNIFSYFSYYLYFLYLSFFCYVIIFAIHTCVSIRDFFPIPIPFLSLLAVHRLLSILAFPLLLPFYLFFHSFLPPYFILHTLFLSLLSTRFPSFSPLYNFTRQLVHSCFLSS